jgi:hypothetical protein
MWMRALVVAACLIALVGDLRGARSQIPDPPKKSKAAASATKSATPRVAAPSAKSTQKPAAAVVPPQSPDKPTYLETLRASEAAIREMLTKRISIDKQDVPLRELMDDLANQLGLQIVIDRQALRNSAIDLDSITTSIKVHDISARSALEMILAEQSLDWVPQNEVLCITTRDVVSQLMTTRVYTLADLVFEKATDPVEPVGGYIADFDSFIDMISNVVAPQTWSDRGGQGTIESFGRGDTYVVVVTHNWRAHEEIAQLIADLRAAKRSPKAQHPKSAPAPRLPPHGLSGNAKTVR